MKNILQGCLFGMILFTSQLFSQTPPSFPTPPAQGPIGGIALVLLALGGAALGYKKLKK